LQAIADNLMTTFATAAIQSRLSNEWTLNQVQAKDNGGSSENSAVSTHTPIVGGDSSGPEPPQSAICLSWKIAASYRGGKPRWYLPGIPFSAFVHQGDSTISSTYANLLLGNASVFLGAFNGTLASGHAETLGTISFQSGHVARPVPFFRAFTDVAVHERVDSQRRRSGKESAFPEVP
jgi:hypothetical protein